MLLKLRRATREDIPALHDLVAHAVRGLMTASYSATQLEAALGTWLGLDTRLVDEGTYFVVEAMDEDGTTSLVGCGG